MAKPSPTSSLSKAVTYWYHSQHFCRGMQEATGCHGAIIIDPAQRPIREGRPRLCRQCSGLELMKDPIGVLAKLKMQR